MRTFIMLILAVASLSSCSDKARNSLSESDDTDKYLQRHEEDDGFVWYYTKNDDYKCILNEDKDTIIYFNGKVRYNLEDKRFYIEKVFYNKSKTDSATYMSLYNREGGSQIIGNGCSDIKYVKIDEENRGRFSMIRFCRKYFAKDEKRCIFAVLE